MPSTIRHNTTSYTVLAPCSTDVPELDTAQAAGVHSNTLQTLQLLYMNSVTCAQKVPWLLQHTHSYSSPGTRLHLPTSNRVQVYVEW